jgi:hypothetical protein
MEQASCQPTVMLAFPLFLIRPMLQLDKKVPVVESNKGYDTRKGNDKVGYGHDIFELI